MRASTPPARAMIMSQERVITVGGFLSIRVRAIRTAAPAYRSGAGAAQA